MTETHEDTADTAPSDTAQASLEDKRYALSPTQTVTVFDDRIEAWSEGKLSHRIVFDSVTQVRLSVEMAGSQTQVVCRVKSAHTEISFASRRAVGQGYGDQVLEFQNLMVKLHQALLGFGEKIQYVEGQTLKFRLIMTGFGLMMATAALMVMGYFLMVTTSPLLAVAGFPFAIIGGTLAWMFRPARPIPYDPKALIERFGG